MTNPSENEEFFNTVQFFPDGSYEYIARGVSAKEAVTRAQSYIVRPAAMIGIIQRVIVTDAGDCICFEWKFREGITFPDSPTIREWNTRYHATFTRTPNAPTSEFLQ